MKVINTGDNFEIYKSHLETYDNLPAQTYQVIFRDMKGFSLQSIDDFDIIEDKIYGEHHTKVDKVKTAFTQTNRSLGVIMSGDKGIGKSLCMQMMAKTFIDELNMPVILVKKPYPGVADFLDTIDQEVAVLFDEFEKTFNGAGESQNSLLGLFDGTSQKKRAYIISINEIHHLNNYMLNRPGRFHYHFRFDYPSETEIKTYMTDKLEPQYHDEIEHLLFFSRRVPLNYDCLRAIAFELNLGYSFTESIRDLNIINVDDRYYNLSVEFKNGEFEYVRHVELDLFSDSEYIEFYHNDAEYSIRFSPKKTLTVDGNIFINMHDEETDIEVEPRRFITEGQTFTAPAIESVQINSKQQRTYHYAL